MAGVINIITKKGASNSATVGFGNYGQQYYKANVGNEKLGVNANLEKFPNTVEGLGYGDVNYTKLNGETRTDIKDVEKKNMGVNYNINDNLYFMLVSKVFIEKIGLMQEDYFLYYEDLDWSMRGKKFFKLACYREKF